MQNKPFIATRELVVFPGVVTPIFIGRQSSLKSLEEAIARFDSKLILSAAKRCKCRRTQISRRYL